MSMAVMGSSFLGAILAAWFLRKAFSLGLILFSLVSAIAMIFVTQWAAGTEQAVFVLGCSFFFGAFSGCPFGGFTIAVTHKHPRAQEVVGITIGAVALSTLLAAAVGMYSGYEFQWLDNWLFAGLIILILVGILKLIFGVKGILDLIIGILASLFWVIYLVHDFNKVVDKYDTASWQAAVEIGMGIYLEMANLFVQLLPLIAKLLDK